MNNTETKEQVETNKAIVIAKDSNQLMNLKKMPTRAILEVLLRIDDENQEIRERQDILEANAAKTENLLRQEIRQTAEKQSIIYSNNETAKPLRDIGRDFVPNLTGEQMGVLISRLGLAQRFRKQNNNNGWETIPYNKDMNPPYPIAIAIPHTLPNGTQVVGYHWYSENLKKKINKALDRIGRSIEFLSLKNGKEVWNFINSL